MVTCGATSSSRGWRGSRVAAPASPSRGGPFRRGLPWATVSTPGGRLLVINTHFAHDSDEDRLAQAADLLGFWNGRPRSAVLGDLNAGPDAAPTLWLPL